MMQLLTETWHRNVAQLKLLIKGLLMGFMRLYSMPEKSGLSAQVLFSERLEAYAFASLTSPITEISSGDLPFF